MKSTWKSLAAVCVLVVGAYAYLAQSPAWEPSSPDAAQAYYNLLVQGFRIGQLSLSKEAPHGLIQLADPYDSAANALYRDAPYRLHDLSYFKGKLYLYWGVTPAVVLFWPYAALTGQYLLHREAVTIFSAIGFLTSAGLLYALWRRYFAEVKVAVVVACALALGFATGAPMLLSWASVYEVPISCGYMLTMLALLAIWFALHEPEPRKRSVWLAAASVAYGMAVGARVTFVFGAVILLVPVAQAWRERREVRAALMAATFPIALIGLGLMVYNDRRFGSPFEFGLRYQLGEKWHVTQRFFSLQYLCYNLRLYLLEPARWSMRFPFVHDIVVPPMPPGHGDVDRPFGILTNIPVVWLALAAPLTWRGRLGPSTAILGWFLAAVALLFGICVMVIGLYGCAMVRYEVDFLPSLLLLAVVGILQVERALANRPRIWRNAARCGWGALLIFSVAFNLLASVEYHAEGHNSLGAQLFQAGQVTEAIREYETALRLKPDYAEAHVDLGTALARLGRTEDAMRHYEEALRIEPDNPVAHYNSGYALYRADRMQDAIKEFEAALRIRSDYAEAHNGLGVALLRAGNVQNAITHYEQAVRFKPDFAEAHYNLGIALARAGNVPEAIRHWEQTVRLKPDNVEARYNLGLALEQTGRNEEASGQYEQALRINPNFVEARQGLERLRTVH